VSTFLEFKKEVISADTKYLWPSQRIRNPKPSWEDLAEGRVAIPERAFSELLRCLTAEKIAILTGSKDSGKTWLCYLIGFRFLINDRADVLFCPVDEKFSADEAYTYLHEQAVINSKSEKKLVILDDCHLNPDEAEEFLSRAVEVDNPRVMFLLSTRKSGKYMLRDVELDDTFHYVGEEKDCVVDLSSRNDGGAYINGIANSFVQNTGMSHKIETDELQYIISMCGDDLYFLRLLLDSWKESSKPISQLTRKHIYDSLWAPHGDIRLVDVSRRAVLTTIAYFSQFEPLKVSREYLQKKTSDYATVQALYEVGLFNVEAFVGVDFLGLPDTLSQLILETVEQKAGTLVARSSATFDLFKDYLATHPVNWLFLFSSLQFATRSETAEKQQLARDVLAALVSDLETTERLATILESAHPRAVQYLLAILKSQQTSDACLAELWRRFKSGTSPRQTASRLLTEARTLSTALSFLQLAEVFDATYAEDVLEQMGSYAERLPALMNQSTATVQTNFLLRFASKNKILLRAALGTESAISHLRNMLNRDCTATTIRHVMPLARIAKVDVAQLFANYGMADWQRVIVKSTLNGMRLLLYRFLSYGLKGTAKAFSEALCRCDVAEVLRKMDATVYRLYGLMGNIRQVDANLGARFVDALAAVPLGDLFLRESSYFEKEGYAKASQINLLLSKTDKFRPGFLVSVVQRISATDWKRLVREAPLKDALWMMWGIYKGDNDKCKEVLDEDVVLRLSEDLRECPLELRLPMLGMFLLCGRSVSKDPVSERECGVFVAGLVKNKQYPRLVLTLISSRELLKLDEYASILRFIEPEIGEVLLRSEDHVERLLGGIVNQLQLLRSGPPEINSG